MKGLSLVLACGMSTFLAAPLMTASVPTGEWLSHVPEKDRVRVNPLLNEPDALAAGAKLFHHDCAQCHGAAADGRGSGPTLRSDRVRHATDGELEWLLKNGNLAHGMPSWSRLPEAQRWQIVRYLHALPVEEHP
jgi:mono/diheme cytochrome c family protein